ncbi:unnamed protein product [Heligmosomoides polygyrus]|uniref:50S ribosomal protein L22 n=1 Tax=Heligmosomoides polygyrus TaxID=6339 RepID=A0A3P8C048_HELPZ|nr:unnamed protein product [Heligmosomoides polygyrus]
METKMLRWTAGVTRLDRVRNDAIRPRFGVAPIAEKLREARLRWYGDVLRANDDTVRKIGLNLEVPGKRHRGRPKQHLKATETILRHAKETLAVTKEGTRGDKATWFWNEVVQIAVKKGSLKLSENMRGAPVHLTAYRNLKKLTEVEVPKAKDAVIGLAQEAGRGHRAGVTKKVDITIHQGSDDPPGEEPIQYDPPVDVVLVAASGPGLEGLDDPPGEEPIQYDPPVDVVLVAESGPGLEGRAVEGGISRQRSVAERQENDVHQV